MPKIDYDNQLIKLGQDLSELELELEFAAGRAEARLKVIALIETPTGVCNAVGIAKASDRLVALCFGAEDFSAAMSIKPLAVGLTWPAQAVAIAAVSAGIHPMGLPGTIADFTDLNVYRELVVLGQQIGICGAACIHPAQVAIVNEVFGGTQEEADAAQRVLDAFDAAVAAGMGAIKLDGRMIDEPVANQARLFLQRWHSRRLSLGGRAR